MLHRTVQHGQCNLVALGQGCVVVQAARVAAPYQQPLSHGTGGQRKGHEGGPVGREEHARRDHVDMPGQQVGDQGVEIAEHPAHPGDARAGQHGAGHFRGLSCHGAFRSTIGIWGFQGVAHPDGAPTPCGIVRVWQFHQRVDQGRHRAGQGDDAEQRGGGSGKSGHGLRVLWRGAQGADRSRYCRRCAICQRSGTLFFAVRWRGVNWGLPCHCGCFPMGKVGLSRHVRNGTPQWCATALTRRVRQ